MATKGKNNKKERLYSIIPPLQPLSQEEKDELKMRIFVAIHQSLALN